MTTSFNTGDFINVINLMSHEMAGKINWDKLQKRKQMKMNLC